VVFGPLPRDYGYQMPVKARRAALRNAVMTKFRDAEVVVADGWPKDAPSTKDAFAILAKLGVSGSATVVPAEQDRNLWLSLRNVPNVDVCPLSDLNAHQVLLRRHIVFTPDALDRLGDRLPEQRRHAAARS
jgi:large subunit ribosomal protein L4